jgi:hypothetical protein
MNLASHSTLMTECLHTELIIFILSLSTSLTSQKIKRPLNTPCYLYSCTFCFLNYEPSTVSTRPRDIQSRSDERLRNEIGSGIPSLAIALGEWREEEEAEMRRMFHGSHVAFILRLFLD